MKDSAEPSRSRYHQRLRSAFHQFRYSISYIDALPQLTFLGLLVGVAAGLVIALFRLCIEFPLGVLLPAGPESFELLSLTQRWWFLGVGGVALLLLLLLVDKGNRQVSVGHVLDRLYNYQGHLPSTNWYVQFLGGVISVISGQSVGREGPAVHLGAGVASRCARWLNLPNNSRYTLIGCGVASAISASFNTPLAGVIFAMEVILMEYTLVGFVPVILASFSGAAIAQLVFGGTPLLQIEQQSQMQTLWELPLMLVLGVVIACAGASFIAIHVRALRVLHWPLIVRLSLAILLTAAIAWPVPEIMGLGYDTLHAAVDGELVARTLLIVGIAKLVSSAAVIALGVPGGIIGPTLVIGACLGGAVGLIAQGLYPTAIADPGFYVIIGMAGMMAAALNAPMAALVAALELTYNPNMIFPSMLVIVIACLITRNVFQYQGIFMEQLRATGRSLDFRPALQVLKKTGIANVLNTNLLYAHRQLDYEQAKKLLADKPDWLVFDAKDDQTRDKTAMHAADLATYLANAPVEVLSLERNIDLLAIPARRLVLSPIHETASLWDALEAMRSSQAEALYVPHQHNLLTISVRGIVTEDAIKNFYRI